MLRLMSSLYTDESAAGRNTAQAVSVYNLKNYVMKSKFIVVLLGLFPSYFGVISSAETLAFLAIMGTIFGGIFTAAIVDVEQKDKRAHYEELSLIFWCTHLSAMFISIGYLSLI